MICDRLEKITDICKTLLDSCTRYKLNVLVLKGFIIVDDI